LDAPELTKRKNGSASGVVMALFNESLVAGECRPSLLRRQLTRTARVAIKFAKPTNRNVARDAIAVPMQLMHCTQARRVFPAFFCVHQDRSCAKQCARSFLSDGAVARRASRLCLRSVSKETESTAWNRIKQALHTPAGMSANSPSDGAIDRLTVSRTAPILTQNEL
jgi:hypothetical protein